MAYAAARVAALRLRRRVEFQADLLDLLAASARRGIAMSGTLPWAAAERRAMDRRTIHALDAALDEGAPIAEALARAPRLLLQRRTLAAVRAADGTAGLGDALEAAADEARDAVESNRRLATALIYPLMICSAAVVFGAVSTGSRWRERVLADGPGEGIFALHDGILVATGALFLLVAGWPWVAAAMGKVGGRGGEPVVQPLDMFSFGLRRTARLFRSLAPLAAAGVPLHRALESAADAEEWGATARGARAAAEAAGRGEPPDAVWSLVPVAPSARMRAAMASCLPPAGFAGALRELAADASERARVRTRGAISVLVMIFVLLVGTAVFLRMHALFGLLERVRTEAAGW